MQNVLDQKDHNYYILRKRYGHIAASKIMEVWDHSHIEEPENPDEALFFYCLGGDYWK